MNIVPIKVEYLNHMGTDLTVVNTARVSFSKETQWLPTDNDIHHLAVEDKNLISYLAKHNHWSPFAHTSVQIRVKAPIFVARQLAKHQIGGSWNEESRRYISTDPEFYLPTEWHKRPEGSIKQGASEELVDLHDHTELDLLNFTSPELITNLAFNSYKNLLLAGVCPEEARMVLPLNTMTNWIWTGSLMFWARVCNQRLDSHAQGATSEVAILIAEYMSKLFPVSWKALTNSKD